MQSGISFTIAFLAKDEKWTPYYLSEKRSLSEDKNKAKIFKNVPYAKTLAKKIFIEKKDKYYGYKFDFL